MPTHEESWEQLEHEAVAHSHRHYHVTHNYRDMTGGFEHLSSEHEHDHDHAAMSHSHYPHEDFDREHAGEAHVHDHNAPVKDAAGSTKAKKAPAKKTAKAPAES